MYTRKPCGFSRLLNKLVNWNEVPHWAIHCFNITVNENPKYYQGIAKSASVPKHWTIPVNSGSGPNAGPNYKGILFSIDELKTHIMYQSTPIQKFIDFRKWRIKNGNGMMMYLYILDFNT